MIQNFFTALWKLTLDYLFLQEDNHFCGFLWRWKIFGNRRSKLSVWYLIQYFWVQVFFDRSGNLVIQWYCSSAPESLLCDLYNHTCTIPGQLYRKNPVWGWYRTVWMGLEKAIKPKKVQAERRKERDWGSCNDMLLDWVKVGKTFMVASLNQSVYHNLEPIIFWLVISLSQFNK